MSSVFETYDMACPKCGSDESIRVQMTVWGSLEPQGHCTDAEHEWDVDSPATCDECDFDGIVEDFAHLSVKRRCILGAVQANLEDATQEWDGYPWKEVP